MSDLAVELEESIVRLIEAYEPFAHPGKDWLRGGDELDRLVRDRDESLARAKPLSERYKSLWSQWESTQPSQEERARIFQARNRIVELGLQVSKLDTEIQDRLRKKSEDLRRQAAEVAKKSKAAKAYSR